MSRQRICNICSVCNRNVSNDCTVSNAPSEVSVVNILKHKKKKKFDNRARNAGETVGQYVAALKHLAADCKSYDAFGKAQR